MSDNSNDDSGGVTARKTDGSMSFKKDNNLKAASIFLSPRSEMLWKSEYTSLIVVFISIVAYLVRNYGSLGADPKVCGSPGFAPWTQKYFFALAAAAIGRTLVQWFRVLIAKFGFSDGKLRHPYATYLLLTMNTIQSISIVCFERGVIKYTCVDYFGVKSTPFLWVDWLSSVPFIFFLISIMDVKQTILARPDLYIQLMGGGSIYLLFLCNFGFSAIYNWIFFILANIFMTVALVWQMYLAYDEFILASEELGAVPPQKLSDPSSKQLHDRVKVSQCKINSSLFICVTFTIIPLIYFICWFGIIDQDTYMVIIYYVSYFVKSIFAEIIGDSHVQILDPNKFLLIEEKRKAENARFAFLKYVFHEVRVPLHSVSLGIQLLQDNAMLSKQDQELVGMMRESTNFMSETLNDVLSLQKIEEGMMQLELKAFSPHSLVKAVANNFRAQFEAKSIDFRLFIDSNVPSKVVGDQFRLEHVLGNLVSNAIKFSENCAQVVVSITYETHGKNHVTFSVKDTGPGLSEDEIKLLFTPYMQIRPGELQKGRGSGLGLSICKTIVSLHNGIISCNSKQRNGDDKLSGGSEFYFSIAFQIPEELSQESRESRPGSLSRNASFGSLDKPLSFASFERILNEMDEDFKSLSTAKEISDVVLKTLSRDKMSSSSLPATISAPVESSSGKEKTKAKAAESSESSAIDSQHDRPAAEINSSANSEQEQKKPQPRQKHRFLICDDVLSNRKMLDLVLKRKGYDCDQCCDGKEAVDLVLQRGLDYYDVIFMDSVMPIMTGPEASEKLRALGFSNLIVGVTGNTMDVDVAHYEERGADIVLGKPIRVEILDKLLMFFNVVGCKSPRNNANIPKLGNVVEEWMNNSTS